MPVGLVDEVAGICSFIQETVGRNSVTKSRGICTSAEEGRKLKMGVWIRRSVSVLGETLRQSRKGMVGDTPQVLKTVDGRVRAWPMPRIPARFCTRLRPAVGCLRRQQQGRSG